MALRKLAMSGAEMVMSVFRQQGRRGLPLDTVATGLQIRFGLGRSESAEAIEEAIDVHGLMCVWGFIYNPLQDGLQDTLDDTNQNLVIKIIPKQTSMKMGTSLLIPILTAHIKSYLLS